MSHSVQRDRPGVRDESIVRSPTKTNAGAVVMTVDVASDTGRTVITVTATTFDGDAALRLRSLMYRVLTHIMAKTVAA